MRIDNLAAFRKEFIGGRVTDVTYDGETFRAELDNGSHIAFGASRGEELTEAPSELSGE